MGRPTQYFVEYVRRWEADELPETEIVDFVNLASAKRYWRKVPDEKLPQVLERRHIEDITPPGDPRGLLWDWDEEVIEDAR